MKILLCISTLQSGGAEKNISILANFLIKKNYDVTILTFDKKKSKPFFFLNKKIKVVNLEMLIESKNFFLSIKNFIFRVKLIRNFIIKEKFKCFISFINTMNITLLFATIYLDIKKIISDRNNPFYSRNSYLVKLLKILVYNSANRLILQTKGSKRFYWFINKKKISIINNFYNPKIAIKKKYKLGKKVKILIVSKIEKQKGIPLLISALKKISNNYNFQCDIYGKGNLISEVKNDIKNKRINNLIFLKKTRDLKNIYRKYDLFILSSYYEGFPNSLVEAMISGLPVISSSCDYGPKEIVKDNFNGVLFEVGSEKDLISKIELLINNYKFATKLGQNAKLQYNPNSINNKNFKKWLVIIKKK